MDTKASGATNRARHDEAERLRHRELAHAPIRLSTLPEERAQRARETMDLLFYRAIVDPDTLGELPWEGDE